jgi:zinc protease
VGYMTDLQRATVEDVKNFFRVYYAPTNATLAIVGDFDPAQAKAWVHKYFSDLPTGKPITRPKVVAPVMSAEKRMTFEDRVQVPHLLLSWVTVGDDNKDGDALQFLAQVLSGQRTARLTKGLVYDKQSAAAVVAFNNNNENAGNFVIEITPRPNNSLTSIEALTDSVIARLKAEGPTAEEMEKTKAGLEFAFVSALQSNFGKAEILNDGAVFHGDPAYYKKQYEELKAVTAADVKRVANKYLSGNRAVLSIVPLGKADQASMADKSVKVTVAPDGGHYIMGGK